MKALTKKKGIVLILIFGMIFLLGSWKLFEWNEFRIQTLNTKKVKTIAHGYTYSLDRVSYSPKTKLIHIEGWILLNGKPTLNHESMIQVVLSNRSHFYIMPTQQIKRKDVTKSINDHKNYDESGFMINCPGQKAIDFDQNDYDVSILIERDGKQYLMSLDTSVKEWKKANAVVKR